LNTLVAMYIHALTIQVGLIVMSSYSTTALLIHTLLQEQRILVTRSRCHFENHARDVVSSKRIGGHAAAAGNWQQ
jgi:maleate cis-trans isomerase